MEIIRKRTTVMNVYKIVLRDARAFREQAKKSKDNSYSISDKEVNEMIAQNLYAIAASLENTPEINP